MSEDFQEYIARIARARGLGGATTREQLDELHAHAATTVRQKIGQPVQRLGLRMFPGPREDKPGRLKTVEARIALSPQQILDASVKETEAEGVDVVLRDVRKALVAAATQQLMQDGYADLRVEGNEAVATLTVSAPSAPAPSKPKPKSKPRKKAKA